MSDRIEAEILDVFGEEVAASVDTPLVVIEGTKGDPGAPGKDGVSPTVSTAATTGGTKVTITDAKGSHEFVVKDGAKGADGSNGKDGTNGKDGADGKPGAAGADGVTPHIGDNGNWYLGATDTGKPSRGATGAKGDVGATGPAGPVGPQGPAGAPGKDGADGETGPQGPKGDPGTPGAAGTPGKDGAGMDITGATVGQIAKITAVDASGVPTAWEPVDMPSGGGSSDAVLYTEQTLTSPQQLQARKNIDALGSLAPNIKYYAIITPATEADGIGVSLSATRSGTGFALDISDVNEDLPTLLTGVKTPTDADTNAATTVEYVKAKVASSGGITPTIGANGNWYVGNTDTGKPSRGATGAKGDVGATGPAGPVGPQGPAGAPGKDGADGKTGPQGPKGDPGTPGAAGAPGKDGAGMDITGATVGQIAKITAVNASGVPTAWEPVDMPSGGSGAANAVLYTAQTLTDAQKKQARENVGAGAEKFLIQSRPTSDGIMFSKSYRQISDAIALGMEPILEYYENGKFVNLAYCGNINRLHCFSGIWHDQPTKENRLTWAFIGTDILGSDTVNMLTLKNDGTLPQQTLASAPTADMQIANKKFVEDTVAASGGGGSAIFIIKADMTSDVSDTATLDKTFAEINEEVVNGKIALMQVSLDGELAYQLPLVEIYPDSFTFAGASALVNDIMVFLISVDSNDKCTFNSLKGFTLNSDETIPQGHMEAEPTADMQIATKKYVDNTGFILKSTTPNSSKKFKVTVDDSGVLSAVEVVG